MKISIIKATLIATLLLFVAGCNELDLNLSGYSIEYPVKDKVYIGYFDAPPAVNAAGTTPLAEKFIINYEKPLSSQPSIVLNGHNIAKHFSFGPSKAVADTKALAGILRHGKNTLTVEPMAFGPAITFDFDAQGPTIVITRGEVKSGNQLEIEGFLRDYSAPDSILTLDLAQIDGYNPNGTIKRVASGTHNITVDSQGKFKAVGTNAINLGSLVNSGKPLLYHFTAKDTYGYLTKVEYLADTDTATPLTLQNAVRVAIGDTFIASMRPVIASAIKTSLDAAPIDARCVSNEAGTTYVSSGSGGSICKKWNDNRLCGKKRGTIPGKNITQEEFDKLVAGGETRPLSDPYFNCDAGAPSQRFYTDAAWKEDGSSLGSINQPVKISMLGFNFDGYIQRFYMHDGGNLTVGGQNLNGKKGTMLLNKFDVLPDDKIDINLTITEMVVQLALKGSGMEIRATSGSGMDIYIQNTIVDSKVLIRKVANNPLVIELQDSNFGLQNVKMNNICIKVWIFPCVGITGLANAFLPMLTGVLEDLLQGILNPILRDNLQKIVIGGTLTQPENQTAIDASLNISELGTKAYLGQYDLKTSLDSVVDVITPDPYAKPILGPVFYDDPINPEDIFNATSGGDANLTVAVNSNFINAVFAAMHSAGVTFFTSHKGKTYYGAHSNVPAQDATDVNSPTIAQKGDTRIRLWPDTPPVMQFSRVVGKDGQARAGIKYDSATLYQDTLREVNGDLVWQTNVEIAVDFDLAVEINEQDGSFVMGAAGPPIFNINKITNNTAFQVPPAFIQGLFDIAMLFGGDLLADRFVVLDLNKIVSDQINGTTVQFLAATDNWKIPATGDNECVVYQNGVAVPHILSTNITTGTDGKYDVVCYTLQFDVSTHTAGVTGNKGNNLLFQMKLADQDLPPPPALPRFDLDGDNKPDYRDNCKVPQQDLEEAVASLSGYSGIPDMVDADGNPKPGVEAAIRSALHTIYTGRYGALTQADKNWYNSLRGLDGDPAVNTNSWVDVLFFNPSQKATTVINGVTSSVGNLCQPDVDRDGIVDYKDNCPGVFNPGQEVNGVYKAFVEGDVGDACDVKKTFVMLRSLGSKLDTGTYQCLTHEGYNTTANGGGTGGGITYSRTMKNDNGRLTKDCDRSDLNQRWYLKEVAGSAAKLANLPANAKATELAGVYHLYADAARDNTNSWQLVAQVAGNGELRMAKMNDPNRLFHTSNNNDYVAGWVLDVDPQALTATDREQQLQPWILRTWKFPTLTRACIFYNNDGWGPDINADQCATTYMNVGSGGKDDLWFRWGIYIGGTDQLWDSSY